MKTYRATLPVILLLLALGNPEAQANCKVIFKGLKIESPMLRLAHKVAQHVPVLGFFRKRFQTYNITAELSMALHPQVEELGLAKLFHSDIREGYTSGIVLEGEAGERGMSRFVSRDTGKDGNEDILSEGAQWALLKKMDSKAQAARPYAMFAMSKKNFPFILEYMEGVSAALLKKYKAGASEDIVEIARTAKQAMNDFQDQVIQNASSAMQIPISPLKFGASFVPVAGKIMNRIADSAAKASVRTVSEMLYPSDPDVLLEGTLAKSKNLVEKRFEESESDMQAMLEPNFHLPKVEFTSEELLAVQKVMLNTLPRVFENVTRGKETFQIQEIPFDLMGQSGDVEVFMHRNRDGVTKVDMLIGKTNSSGPRPMIQFEITEKNRLPKWARFLNVGIPSEVTTLFGYRFSDGQQLLFPMLVSKIEKVSLKFTEDSG